MPCTTILVGKKASYDGSTMIARNDDSGAGHFTPKKFAVIHPEEQPREYESVISHVKIKLPDDPMQYTAFLRMVDRYQVEAVVFTRVQDINEEDTRLMKYCAKANVKVLFAPPVEELGGMGHKTDLPACLQRLYVTSRMCMVSQDESAIACRAR